MGDQKGLLKEGHKSDQDMRKGILHLAVGTVCVFEDLRGPHHAGHTE